MSAIEHRYVIGIDPGTVTGFSVFDRKKDDLMIVDSGSLIECYHSLLEFKDVAFVRIEDARKRKWYGNAGRGKLQGVGSVKRDCKIWQEICEYHDFEYELVHPKNNTTKLTAEQFKKYTKWDGQTNEHKRDSAMLVYKI